MPVPLNSSSFTEDEVIAVRLSCPRRSWLRAEQALDERRALAGHARARHHEVEARRLGALLDLVVHVRVDAERARALELARSRRSSNSAMPSKPAGRGRRSAPRAGGCAWSGPASCASWPAARSMPSTLEPSSRSSKTATTRAIYCARMRRNSWRTDSGRPHIWDGLDAAGAQLAQRELAPDARVVEQVQRAVHGLRRGGVAEPVGDEQAPVPVVPRVGLRVDGEQEHRGIDVAALVDAQVELHAVQSDGSESRICWKVSASAMIRGGYRLADPPIPPDPDELLREARG